MSRLNAPSSTRPRPTRSSCRRLLSREEEEEEEAILARTRRGSEEGKTSQLSSMYLSENSSASTRTKARE
eukprot:744881-Hanusia_phi.AAC.1